VSLAPRTLSLTAAALLAFAGNSLLCRLALRTGTIDAASFGTIRLAAGALTLWLVVRARGSTAVGAPRDAWAAAMLFAYVAFFSWAYLGLTAGTGALVLFGAVQITMFAVGLRGGERFSAVAWCGAALAVAGLVYLVAPGIAAPPPLPAASMAVAGVAWGAYTLRGRGVADPLAATARNFAWATPLAVALSLAAWSSTRVAPEGVALAIASGAITSGLGYVIWYAALRGLTALQAATVQLAVPLVAAFAGVLWLGESITPRLALASVSILGGIALVLGTRARRART
jgi:drug/metabolite transporter (DMT)-like permease